MVQPSSLSERKGLSQLPRLFRAQVWRKLTFWPKNVSRWGISLQETFSPTAC